MGAPMGPATVVVALLIGLCLIVGGLVLSSARARRRRGDLCPACGKSNRPSAKYCAHCGHPLRNA